MCNFAPIHDPDLPTEGVAALAPLFESHPFVIHNLVPGLLRLYVGTCWRGRFGPVFFSPRE
jgi:hypothetical protein